MKDFNEEEIKYMELINEGRKYVFSRIQNNTYPQGHIFNSNKFGSEDFVIYLLAIIKIYIRDTVMLDDYIDKKLKADNNGKFDIEIYYQGLNEIIFYVYLLMGSLESGILKDLSFIAYESSSITNHDKRLEYSFVYDDIVIGVEIKTISCDSIFKEKDFNINKTKYIKKYFRDFELNGIEDVDDYVILQQSTHDRQLRKNIKKIIEKFKGENQSQFKTINIGVIYIQFATSKEEFYSYLLNEKRGIVKDIDFGNLDALVLFSLTGRPRLDMEDVYNTGHTFTVLLNDDNYVLEYLGKLRLDNIIASKINGVIKIESAMIKYINKEYGKFKLINRDRKAFFVNESESEERINEYISYLDGNQEYPYRSI